jgi:hypothetical protein
MNLPALALLALSTSQAGDSALRLRIDPLLVAAVTDVYALITGDDNPVWPGWDALQTPVLLYLPDVQDLLLNHPKPPAGFVPFETDMLPSSWSAHVRSGATLIEFDGQNTSMAVAGVQTLVVADPISNLRPQLVQLLGDPRSLHERTQALDVDMLRTDPYEQLAFVVHEAFHVHQARQASGKAANEMWLLDYPWLAAENNAGFALEGRALERALLADDADARRAAALEWIGVRLERRAELPPEAVAYEDGTEFNEGLAKYTEWSLSRALEGREPGPGLRWARDFRGYQDLGFWRRQLLTQMRGNMDGEVIINGDPYGSGMIRFRLYYSGMAIAALLDELGADGWHQRIFEPETTLTGLVREALDPTYEELVASAERAFDGPEADDLLEQKEALERAGRDDARRKLDAILAGDARFTLDYSAIGAVAASFAFTPFGLTRVDEDRVIYAQTPVTAQLGAAASIHQQAVSPMLHDERSLTISFQLLEPLDSAALARLLDLDALPEQALTGIAISLPGASIQAAKGVFEVGEGSVTLRLVR